MSHISHLLRAVAVVIVAFGASSLAAQARVLGRVTLPDNETPVAGALVRVTGTSLGALVDADGRFEIADVPAGVHTIEARAPGHALALSTVTLRVGAAKELMLHLVPGPQELAGVRVIGGSSDALARLPGSAKTVSQRTIESIQPMSANDVLRTVAGVHLQDEEGAGLRANIGIRGLDPDRSRTVLVLEDGLPVSLAPYGEPEMYYSPPIDRMSRVEVIKGSGSILFGPQTIGGVVNYVTADPAPGFNGRVDVRGGAGGQEFGRLQLGGTRGDARGIVTGFRRSADDLNGLQYDVTDATVKVGFRTGLGDLSAKLSVYDESSNATYVGLTDSLFHAAPLTHPMPTDRLVVSRQALSLAHEVAVAGGTLRTSAYSYRTVRDWMRRNYIYGATGGTIVPGGASGGRDRSFRVLGIEPRYQRLWTAGGVVSALDAGARFHHEWARDQFVNGTADGAPTDIRDDEFRTGTALSAWVQNRVALSETFDLTPGLRVERFAFDRNITRGRVRRDDGGSTTRTVEDLDIRSGDTVSEFIPGLGATWRPRELVTLFAGAHRGFAPPRTKDALIYSDPTLAPDQQVPDPISLQLDPERSWNFEVGTRSAPRPWLSFEITGFLMDFTNQIIEPSLSAGSTAAAALANQGATRHRGVELGGSLDLGKWAGRATSVIVEGHYTYSDARFSRDRLIVAGSDTVNVNGNALPYAPRNRAHAALVLDHPAGVRTRLDASFVGRQFSDNFETTAASANGRIGEIRAFRVYDVTLQYDIPWLPGAMLSGGVKNLSDARYIASRRPEGIKVGLPRLVTLGLSYGF